MSSFLNIQISGSTSSASEHDRRSISLQRGFGSGPTSSLADCFLTMSLFIREFLASLQCNVLYQYREFLQSACVYVNIFLLQCPQTPPGPTSLRPPSYAGSEDESNGSSSSSRTPRWIYLLNQKWWHCWVLISSSWFLLPCVQFSHGSPLLCTIDFSSSHITKNRSQDNHHHNSSLPWNPLSSRLSSSTLPSKRKLQKVTKEFKGGKVVFPTEEKVKEGKISKSLISTITRWKFCIWLNLGANW